MASAVRSFGCTWVAYAYNSPMCRFRPIILEDLPAHCATPRHHLNRHRDLIGIMMPRPLPEATRARRHCASRGADMLCAPVAAPALDPRPQPSSLATIEARSLKKDCHRSAIGLTFRAALGTSGRALGRRAGAVPVAEKPGRDRAREGARESSETCGGALSLQRGNVAGGLTGG